MSSRFPTIPPTFPYRSETSFVPYNAKIPLVLNSAAKSYGTNQAASFQFNPSLAGLLAVECFSFTTYNVFPNIVTYSALHGIGNELAFTFTPAYTTGPSTCIFPQGRWICNQGTLTNVEVRAGPALPNDIRYYMINHFLSTAGVGSDALLSVTLDYVSGKLTLVWNSAFSAVTWVTVAGSIQYTLAAQLGFDGINGSSNMTGVNIPNLGGPTSIGISLSEGTLENDVSVIGTGERKQWMWIIPVNVPYGGYLYYEPFNLSTLLTRSNSKPLNSFTVTFYDTGSGLPLVVDNNVPWELRLWAMVNTRP